MLAVAFVYNSSPERHVENIEMADELLGKILGKYKIESLIGRGGMATVYLATHQQLGTKVALKVLPTGFADQHEMAERFLREARTAAQLNHPNIVRVYDVDQIDGVSFFVMDFVEGQTLKAVMKKKGTIPEEQIVDISRSVLSALEEAHSSGVIHRDVKPDNIMIDRTGKALVTDFGIAKTTMDSDLTKTGMFLGTMKYASPEQIKGEPVDSCSELYSWGVVMYEMATGGSAFKSDEPTAILYNILNESPADPHLVNPSLSQSLVKIITRAISKVRDDRYQSTGEFLEALEDMSLDDDETRLLSAAGEDPDRTELLSGDALLNKLATENGDEDPDRTKFLGGDELLDNLAKDNKDEISVVAPGYDEKKSHTTSRKRKGFSVSAIIIVGVVFFALCGGLIVYNNSNFFSLKHQEEMVLEQKSQPDLSGVGKQEDEKITETAAAENKVIASVRLTDEGKDTHFETKLEDSVEDARISRDTAISSEGKEPKNQTLLQNTGEEKSTEHFTLNISVSPDYARVILNGSAIPQNSLGKYNLSLPSGDARVEVKANNYTSYSEQVSLQQNHEIKVDLVPVQFSLTILFSPNDSIVAIDGNTIDSLKVGKVMTMISPGEHTITIGASGFKTEILPILMDKDRSVVINLEKMDNKISYNNQTNKDGIDIWTDKNQYHIGDNLKVFFRVEKDCYVYLYHESADGNIQLIFPNEFIEDNYITGGKTYTIPDPSYDFQFTVQPPLGTERIKALVTSEKKVLAQWQQLKMPDLKFMTKKIKNYTTLKVIE